MNPSPDTIASSRLPRQSGRPGIAHNGQQRILYINWTRLGRILDRRRRCPGSCKYNRPR